MEQIVAPISEQTLQGAKVPISAVTVYRDRAEVQRIVKVDLEPGLNRVIFENVASSIIGDSIRVDGKGSAIIHEVQFREEYLEASKVTSPQIESLREEVESVNAQKEVLADANAVMEKQLAAIGDILGNFGKSALADHQGTVASLAQFDSGAEQSLEMLYAFHERKSRQLKERSRAQRKELEQLKEKLEALKTKLRELEQKGAQKKSIAVDLENVAGSGQEVELILTYQVHNARWSPSYDFRAQLPSGDEEQLKSVKISYFGVISQNSGENWENVRLALSTAQPSCGQLPRIGTTFAQFYRPPPPRPPQAPPVGMFGSVYGQGSVYMGSAPASMQRGQNKEEMEGASLYFGVAQTEAVEQPLSTTFHIAQAKSIPDGDAEHKVTIAVLDLDCLPHFDCVPSKNTNVFMSASVRNLSAYPLLPGWASVYLNNCFNQKVHVDAVAAGDKFDIPLGVCSDIKINYKPTNKFHHQTGVLSKSSNLVNEQKIVVKNSRKGPLILTLVEPIPKPTDEKIKIRLLSPELSQPRHIVHVINGTKSSNNSSRSSVTTEETTSAAAAIGPRTAAVEPLKAPALGTRMNADNNLEWTVLLEAGAEMELTVKWEAEFPPSEKLEFNEKRGNL